MVNAVIVLSSSFHICLYLPITTFLINLGVLIGSSGTGGAGIIGAVSYLMLTSWMSLSITTSFIILSVSPFLWMEFEADFLMIVTAMFDGICVFWPIRRTYQKR